ncbi:porin [Aeromonas allosaccharophila]|uniref:porin n=1 Tax=Aeromonas TaxID=642 RepID=UPI0013CB0AFD|nr:porin [Aeromonas allosaccharophila]WDO03825.1 porin [Aeromonas allosaccharophila]
MKKTILAIAIPALFASAANAAVIYDKDGTTFDVYGRVQANYVGEHDNDDGSLKGSSRLGWSGKIGLNNTWSAIAKTEWQVAAENSDNVEDGTSDSDDGKFQARHLYVGFDGGQNGQVIFGQTDTAFYDAIAATDIMNEYGDMANFYEGRQEGQIIYSNKVGGFTGKLSYQTTDDTAKVVSGTDASSTLQIYSFDDVKRKSAYAVAAGYAFDFGLGLNAGYAYSDLEGKAGTALADNDGEKKDWAVSANYGINGFYFAGMYTEGEVKNKTTGGKHEGKGYELAASYSVDAWKLLAAYNKAEVRNPASNVGYFDVVDHVALGVQYNFTSKLNAYGEYMIQGLDKQDDQYNIGLQYNF